MADLVGEIEAFEDESLQGYAFFEAAVAYLKEAEPDGLEPDAGAVLSLFEGTRGRSSVSGTPNGLLMLVDQLCTHVASNGVPAVLILLAARRGVESALEANHGGDDG